MAARDPLIKLPSQMQGIAGAYCYSLVLEADGKVAIAGGAGYAVTNIPAGLANVMAIAAGGFHCLAFHRERHTLSPSVQASRSACA